MVGYVVEFVMGDKKNKGLQESPWTQAENKVITANELIQELYLALKVLWAEVDDPQLMDVVQEALHLAACYIDDHPRRFGSRDGISVRSSESLHSLKNYIKGKQNNE